MKTPTLIISSDEHIRETIPKARIDNYWNAQCKKIEFLRDLQGKYDGIPILSGGDLLDKARVSPELESWCIHNLPFGFFDVPGIVTIPGNHELPSHNLELLKKSSLNVLDSALKVEILRDYQVNYAFSSTSKEYSDTFVWVYGYPWGSEFKLPDFVSKKKRKIPILRNIAVCHYLVYENENPFPNAKAERAIDFLKRMKGFDLIICGHNHQSFVVNHRGRLLVNPGSMMRMHADQMDHKPRVYLYYAEDNTVEPIYYPIEPSEKVLTREYIEKKKERDDRIQSLVIRLDDDKDEDVSISFTDNMTDHLDHNPTNQPVKDFIWECING